MPERPHNFRPLLLIFISCISFGEAACARAAGLLTSQTTAPAKLSGHPGKKSVLASVGSSLDPDLVKVLKVVDGYLAQGSFIRAENLIADELKEHPNNFALNLEQAQLLRGMGRFARAKTLYLVLHGQQPSAPEPLIALSQMSLESLSMDDALKYGREAVTFNPSSKTANLALAAALIYNNALSEANKRLAELEQKFPHSAEVSYLRYQLMLREGKNDQALTALEQAVLLKPGNSGWLLDLCTLYKEEGHYAASLDTANRYLHLNPGSIEALSKVATLDEYNFHDYDKAILAYQQILKLDPDIVDAVVGIDRCKQKGNDIAAALKDQLWKFLRQSKTFGDSTKPVNRSVR